ncbi:MAG: aminopeptidase [Micavibrio sp.]
MKIKELGPFYQRQIATVKTLAAGQSLWRDEAKVLLPLISKYYRYADADDLLTTLNRMDRLDMIHQTGLENESAFKIDVRDIAPAGWASFGAPPVDVVLQESLAAKLYNAKAGSNDVVQIELGEGSRNIGPWLINRARKDKIPFIVRFIDPNFSALLINHAPVERLQDMGKQYLKDREKVNKKIVSYPGMADGKQVNPHPDKSAAYAKEVRPFNLKSSTGEVFYTLTIIPTRKDAQIDGIPYDDYLKLFFEMCDQPWPQITNAQKELIKEFNAASQVRITNNDGTDVSMSLVDHDGSHFTFCNSVIAKNVPGSEIFSAPRRDSVNGTVVAKGRFEHDDQLIENLTMEFKNGELVRYDAEKGLEAFRRAVTMDDGARYVGELGIGTNPHLKKHVVNSLLVEKIGGSFHLALGRPYSYTEYGGETVKVDNGGRSGLHWDITTMLHGKEGCIYLDGRKIMDNGQWLDQKYDILNRGWESVPRDQRPDYWKDYYNKPKGP